MGLAASQARLLTITSRLSAVEMRQERIAMDKIRLASDSEEVSSTYTNALNNKTLTMKNNGAYVPLTYDLLESQGYSIMRTNDGVIASSGAGTTTTTSSNNSESGSSQRRSAGYYSKNGENVTDNEVLKWIGQEKPTISEADNTPPVAPTEPRMEEPKLTLQDVPATVDIKSLASAKKAAQSAINTVPIKRDASGRIINSFETNSNAIKKMSLELTLSTLQEELQAYNLTEQYATLVEAREKAQEQYEQQSAGQYPKYSTNYGKSPENVYGTIIMQALYSIEASISTQNASIPTIQENNATAQATYNVEMEKYNANKALWDKYDQENASYTNRVRQHNTDLVNWNYAQELEYLDEATANARYGNGSTVTTPVTTTASSGQELLSQLRADSSGKFLIQGLLSGYFTLVKDGKEVSISSELNITEEFDTSDDTKAEAEYNAAMKKINYKEKMLDMQARRLETEYSALTQEYESVKQIVSNHAQKDFTLFG